MIYYSLQFVAISWGKMMIQHWIQGCKILRRSQMKLQDLAVGWDGCPNLSNPFSPTRRLSHSLSKLDAGFHRLPLFEGLNIASKRWILPRLFFSYVVHRNMEHDQDRGRPGGLSFSVISGESAKHRFPAVWPDESLVACGRVTNQSWAVLNIYTHVTMYLCVRYIYVKVFMYIYNYIYRL